MDGNKVETKLFDDLLPVELNFDACAANFVPKEFKARSNSKSSTQCEYQNQNPWFGGIYSNFSEYVIPLSY